MSAPPAPKRKGSAVLPWVAAVRTGLVLLVAPLLVLLGAGAATAEPPLTVVDPITDRVGALAAGAPAANQAVEELSAAAGVKFYAVFVSSFDTTADKDWAAETARASRLGGSDMLLAVAVGTETYEYRWWLGGSFPLSEVDVERMLVSEVEPAMNAGDWAGGVTALAGKLRSETSSMAGSDRDAEPSDGLLWTGKTTLAIVGALFAVLLVAHLLSRRGRMAPSSG